MNLRIEQLSPLDLGQDGTDSRRKWPPTQWRVLKKAHNRGWTDFHTEHFIILLLEANIFLFLIKLLLISELKVLQVQTDSKIPKSNSFQHQHHLYIYSYISAKIWNTGGKHSQQYSGGCLVTDARGKEEGICAGLGLVHELPWGGGSTHTHTGHTHMDTHS